MQNFPLSPYKYYDVSYVLNTQSWHLDNKFQVLIGNLIWMLYYYIRNFKHSYADSNLLSLSLCLRFIHTYRR